MPGVNCSRSTFPIAALPVLARSICPPSGLVITCVSNVCVGRKVGQMRRRNFEENHLGHSKLMPLIGRRNPLTPAVSALGRGHELAAVAPGRRPGRHCAPERRGRGLAQRHREFHTEENRRASGYAPRIRRAEHFERPAQRRRAVFRISGGCERETEPRNLASAAANLESKASRYTATITHGLNVQRLPVFPSDSHRGHEDTTARPCIGHTRKKR
jgi:hypothetical protein